MTHFGRGIVGKGGGDDTMGGGESRWGKRLTVLGDVFNYTSSEYDKFTHTCFESSMSYIAIKYCLRVSFKCLLYLVMLKETHIEEMYKITLYPLYLKYRYSLFKSNMWRLKIQTAEIYWLQNLRKICILMFEVLDLTIKNDKCINNDKCERQIHIAFLHLIPDEYDNVHWCLKREGTEQHRYYKVDRKLFLIRG